MRPHGTNNCDVRVADGRTHIAFASSDGPHFLSVEGELSPPFQEAIIDLVRAMKGDAEDMRRELAERCHA